MKVPEQSQGQDRYDKKKIVIVIIGTTIGVYLGLQFILPLVVPFVFAYFIAKAIKPIAGYLQNHFRIPRMIGGAFVVATILSIVCMGIWFFCNVLLGQIKMLLQNIPIYKQLFISNLNSFCCHCDEIFGLADGDSQWFFDSNMEDMVEKVRADFMPMMTQRTVQIMLGVFGVIGVVFVIIIAVIMIIKDMPDLKKKYETNIFYNQIHPITHKLSDLGFAYLRAQIIIISIISVILVLGLFILHNPYAILIGLGIALFDAFPVLGSGSIIIPWAGIELFQGKLYAAAVLVTMYLCCQLVRQLLEPKLIGDKIGIKPIFTIMAMYIGLNLFGIIGIFLGPVALVIIQTIVAEVISNM